MEEIRQPSQRELEELVTLQIGTAEDLADTGSEEYRAAWSVISQTEEAIADAPDATPGDKYFAERGAVAAAYKSGDEERALSLQDRYGISKEEILPMITPQPE